MSRRPAADKRASTIARHIEADIIRRGWPIGESLGSERALQERYRVSRSVLREAVRLVEHHKVARMRRGPSGGLLVCEPDAGPRPRQSSSTSGTWVPRSATCSMRASCWNPWRPPLPPNGSTKPASKDCAPLCTRRNSRNPGVAGAADDFFLVLAEQTKNPVLQLFIDVLMRLTARYARDSRQSASEAVEARADASRPVRIVSAVTAGDSARAKTLSERHLGAVTDGLSPTAPGRAGGDRRQDAVSVRHHATSSPRCWRPRSATISRPAAGRSVRSSGPSRCCWSATV